MAKDVVLSLGEGYQPEAAPAVSVDVFGEVYRARKPKTTTPFLIAEVQERFAELGELEDVSAEQLKERLGEARKAVRLLVRSMFNNSDTDKLLNRMVDPEEDHLDLHTVFDIHAVVQEHFADDIADEHEDMGLDAPHKAASQSKKAPARKTAAKKTTSRKTGARKAAAARR